MKKSIITICSLLSLFLTNAQEVNQQNLKLWYQQPAEKWTDALPIGNGRLGAMIFGTASEEHIQFNEETLWTGGPRKYQHEGAAHYLAPIRKLLAEGRQADAEELAEEHFMGTKSDAEGYDSLKDVWYKRMRKDTAAAASKYNDNQWKEIKLPAANGWETAGLEGVDGSVWLRNSFILPKDWEGKNLMFELGRIRDIDFTYLNGKLIGNSEGNTKHRRYIVNEADLKKGKNQLSIQVINFYDKGGLVGIKNFDKGLIVHPVNDDKNILELDSTWKYWIQDDNPPVYPQYEASYQPFGDVWLHLKNISNVSNYQRSLDLTNAVSRVSYTSNGVTYTREYFASAPDQTIVMHLMANQPGKISLNALFTSPHKISSTKKIDDRTLALFVKVRNGVLKGTAYLHVVANGGKISVRNNEINLQNCTDATFYLMAATSFKNFKDVSGNPNALCQQTLQKLKSKSFQAVKSAHINDYQQYFNTFSINLGNSKHEAWPTDERIRQYAPEVDPALIALYVQYARYLLISSSRPGTQPANLQGIWNDLLTPPWGSKYTTNINLEMNYWPADVLNLPSLTQPLFHLIDDVADAGKSTAKIHYNAPGWVLHHNTDLWRGTAPINASNHGIWQTGGAWLCHHIWDHYQFTQDTAFLQKHYPEMRGAADFFVHTLVKDPKTGWLITSPSNSPEHGGMVAGPTMDLQIIRDLFKNCIAAAEILNTDKDFRKTLQEKYNQLAPNQIGKLGELQEWLEDKEDTSEHHRHVSHLWGVYPGTDITWQTPDLMKAARQSLLYRGDEGTGWSLAWKVNLWARFKEGDHALKMVDKLLSPAEGASGSERGGVYHNLFDAHPPFQIDGNFGGSAGIAEMLLQSQNGTVELLPALPAILPNGEVNGICARGGFEINMQWQNGALEQAEILSKNGNDCVLRYREKEIRFPTQKGKRYSFDGNLEKVTVALK